MNITKETQKLKRGCSYSDIKTYNQILVTQIVFRNRCIDQIEHDRNIEGRYDLEWEKMFASETDKGLIYRIPASQLQWENEQKI